jgi:manganese oxidase
VRLEARQATWYPDDTAGVPLPVFAFAEAGQPAMIPGPMIRVPTGTTVRATIRNVLPVPLYLRGLQERASSSIDSVVIGPGATQELEFRADVAGTYYYWGRTDSLPPNAGHGRARDATLVGAFIVDPAGTSVLKGERILVITSWVDTNAALGVKSEQAHRVMLRETFARERWVALAVNGRSWPHTERLSHVVGDTIRWRVINGSRFPHPMHLHGFYFDVDARGDARRDTVYTPVQRRTVVTEWMVAGTTLAMTWVPTRPGNWLFHCHLVTHISDALQLGAHGDRAKVSHVNHAETGMAGLVVGVHVAPATPVRPARDPTPRRILRLLVTERAHVYGERPGYSYVLQKGSKPPAPDSIRSYGSTLVLRQNEPSEITVVNATTRSTSIHWHGIEIESFYDGVGDWSGWGSRVAAPIAPRDSFVVRLTPPRAGTFIYHTHTSEGLLLASGLYGALLVLPENALPDTTDRLVLIGIGGPLDDSRPVVNGSTTPPPFEVRAGVAHRFRFINISPLETHRVQLAIGDTTQEWRALAKDGADLPTHQATRLPAFLLLHPGETYDFEVMRERPGSLTLRINSPGTVADRAAAVARQTPAAQFPRIITEIPVIVR